MVKDHLNSFKAIPIFLMLHKGESNDTIDNLALQNKKTSIKERKWQILTPINKAVVIVQVDLMQRADSSSEKFLYVEIGV